MKNKYRYEFSWVNEENYREISAYVIATSKKEAIAKFLENISNNPYCKVPKNYTIKKTFSVDRTK